MKKNVFLILFSILMASCGNDSLTDEFNDVNGNDPEPIDNEFSKLLTRVSVASALDAQENETIIISYDGDNRVSNVSNGESAGILVYNNGSLSNIADGTETLSIEELYNSPYDAFKTGAVEQYDEKGNPKIITFFQEEYNYNTGISETIIFTAEVFYDEKPNPYFYTLKAAGIIEVLDNVDLNFSLTPQIPDIVKARTLFPLNNINRIVYKDDRSVVVFEILVDYVYNEFNYPTSAAVTALSLADNETSIYTISYSYKQ
ncbi:hypothetical protein [Yeosuana sp. AK3]